MYNQRFGFGVPPFGPRPFVPYGRRPFFGAPLAAGLLGGLIGSTVFNPYFYGGYPFAPVYPPFGYGGFFW
ncbi:hypothetical protein [Litchfieldia alkalitelluris]|uniref:hypothetical protein n=1 Tax=Litchfieldia alkalitelluris TaxID=304268 RepID=UPI000997404B|nr:hypothetical protein [Litchfieldia alkalitelluris]